MKKRYERPSAYIEEFTPNEYVAACGDSGTVYNFECNAGKKGTSYYVYTNGADGVPGTSDDVWLGSYHPCGKTHSAESNSDFAYGYMYKEGFLGIPDQRNRIDVVIWRGEKGNNIHCTTELDINKWTTAKS